MLFTKLSCTVSVLVPSRHSWAPSPPSPSLCQADHHCSPPALRTWLGAFLSALTWQVVCLPVCLSREIAYFTRVGTVSVFLDHTVFLVLSLVPFPHWALGKYPRNESTSLHFSPPASSGHWRPFSTQGLVQMIPSSSGETSSWNLSVMLAFYVGPSVRVGWAPGDPQSPPPHLECSPSGALT